LGGSLWEEKNLGEGSWENYEILDDVKRKKNYGSEPVSSRHKIIKKSRKKEIKESKLRNKKTLQYKKKLQKDREKKKSKRRSSNRKPAG